MTLPKRFVSWAAVSSLPQAKKISLDEQLAVNREHIANRGGTLLEELIVPGESRSIVLFEDACKRIPAYARLHELIKAKAFDVLIYLDRSRLGRIAALSMTVVELCHKAGIVCYEIESPPASLEPSQSSHDGALIGAIKSVGAQHEIDKLKERNAFGMVGRIQRGEFAHAAPWGWLEEYRQDGKRVHVIDPQAQESIQVICTMYLEHGAGNVGIAEELNRLGYPSPAGGIWWKSSIQHVIRRAWLFAGYTEINKRSYAGRPHTRAKGKFPALISEATAAALTAEMERRVKARRSVGSTHLLSQCVWCDVCKRPMTAEWSTKRYKDKKYLRELYKCKGGHERAILMAHKATSAIRAAIEYVQDIANRQRLLAEADGNTSSVEADIERTNNKIAEVEKSIERADDAYVSGSMSPERYKRQVERLTVQMADVQRKAKALAQARQEQERGKLRGQRLVEVANEGLEMLANPDIATANAWMRCHLRVWVRGGDVARVEYL